MNVCFLYLNLKHNRFSFSASMSMIIITLYPRCSRNIRWDFSSKNLHRGFAPSTFFWAQKMMENLSILDQLPCFGLWKCCTNWAFFINYLLLSSENDGKLEHFRWTTCKIWAFFINYLLLGSETDDFL